VALTFWQKLRVAFRGWSRRREEANAAFLRQNASWSGGLKPASTQKQPHIGVDLEGLQVAYLDDSGQISYYLDTMTGEVVEVRNRPAPPGERFKRVPSRTAETDVQDRRAFVASLDDSPLKSALMSAAPGEFRRVLGTDRGVERAWYNFKNAQATRSIESWLRNLGLQPPHRG
jgi:hypothetical protein